MTKLAAAIRAQLRPAHVAGLERFARYMGYQFLGFALVNAGALAANALLRLQFGPDVVSAGSMLATAAAAGARRTAVWSQVDTASIPTIAIPPGGTRP